MTNDPRRPVSRRKTLAALGLGAVGLGAIGPSVLSGQGDTDPEPLSPQWYFGPYRPGFSDVGLERTLAPVVLPHSCTTLSWRGWEPETWQRLWVYRCRFDAPADLGSDRLFFDIGAALTLSTVYLNGRRISRRAGGYLPHTVELTDGLVPRDNVLSVLVDGRWHSDVPPNRPHAGSPSTIDFYQPAGLYRPASLRRERERFLTDLFAKPVDVLYPARRRVEVTARLDGRAAPDSTVHIELTDGATTVREATVPVPAGRTRVRATLSALPGITLWDTDDPRLYTVRATLFAGGRSYGHRETRIGFRSAEFRKDGFFLNGTRRKLFGLNRHQWYPFVGAAMPDRVQRKDAEILRNELNCNMVRCSHYPQSEAFLDACDELGLMVWEEAPGWDYIGDKAWRRRVRRDVAQMVVRDRNHPSIIAWGTRLNETIDDAALYVSTNRIAKRLDGSRATTGAINRTPRATGEIENGPGAEQDPYWTTSISQDVFAYNDYTRTPSAKGKARLRPPRVDLPYLISEAVGTIVGAHHYRRVDAEQVQRRQALLHAAVHDDAASDDRYCGLLAWCAFDYPSGWYHSLHGIKWPGVCDFFRIPKLGAAFYRAQCDPNLRPVIEPGFHWDRRHGPPGRDAPIFSNCDSIVVTVDNGRPRRVTREHGSIRYPPFHADLRSHDGSARELRIEGYLAGKRVLTRRFCADRESDRLSLLFDDTWLRADGSDATRLVLRAVDRYGNQRAHVEGDVRLDVRGPVTRIGPDPFPLEATGGAGAVWLRSLAGRPGTVIVRARHPRLGTASAGLTVHD